MKLFKKFLQHKRHLWRNETSLMFPSQNAAIDNDTWMSVNKLHRPHFPSLSRVEIEFVLSVPPWAYVDAHADFVAQEVVDTNQTIHLFTICVMH